MLPYVPIAIGDRVGSGERKSYSCIRSDLPHDEIRAGAREIQTFPKQVID